VSTRSVTTIRTTSGGAVALYRHHDGYPAAAGGAILDALKGATSAEAVAARLLALQYEVSAGRIRSSQIQGTTRGVYQLTISAENHGDLEHTYEVVAAWVRNGLVFSIRHGRRPNYDNWQYATYTVPEFIGIVNRDRTEINRRIETSGHYVDSDLFSLFTLEEFL
jgi:hypothetical protein